MKFEDFEKQFKSTQVDEDTQHMQDLALQIIEARINKGMTQKELAELIGTRQSSIARLESGTSYPTIPFLKRIAKVLEVKLLLPKFVFEESHQVETKNSSATSADTYITGLDLQRIDDSGNTYSGLRLRH